MESATLDDSVTQHSGSLQDDEPAYIVLPVALGEEDDNGDDVSKTKKTFQCTSCGKRYERLDHVKRHIKSRELCILWLAFLLTCRRRKYPPVQVQLLRSEVQ